MKSFEEFKASREKMDPSTLKMSEHQWSQAYAAYCSARERRSSASSSSGTARRRSSSGSSTKGSHAPSTVSATGALRARVRAESAYADLRLMVNVLSWVLLGVIVIVAVLQGMTFATPTGSVLSLLIGAIQVLGVILLRMIVHVVIDIPDVALFRACEAQRAAAGDEAD